MAGEDSDPEARITEKVEPGTLVIAIFSVPFI